MQQFLACSLTPSKRDVLVCSFNCRVVADAALKAGCRVETFDFSDTTGRIGWENVADRLAPHHRAIVVPHLFGVPADFRSIRAAADRAGVLIVEDCAHTLGGTLGAAVAGTVGDAAIFSFNYDKPISLGGGGVLLINNPEWSRRITLRPAQVTLECDEQELSAFLEYLRRRREGDCRSSGISVALARTLSHLSAPMTHFHAACSRSDSRPLFRATGIGPLRAALGQWQLRRYPEIIRQRNANAAYFAMTADRSWHVDADVDAAWLKQKAIPPRFEDSRRVSEALRKRGIPVGTFNWSTTIDQYVGSAKTPYARHVAAHSLDIPIHQNVERSELDIICGAFTGRTPLAAHCP